MNPKQNKHKENYAKVNHRFLKKKFKNLKSTRGKKDTIKENKIKNDHRLIRNHEYQTKMD